MARAATAATGNRDLFRYDRIIVGQLNRIEERITKFALQNYTSSGAVLLAFFATKIPLLAAFLVVLVLNSNFIAAIAHNAWRYKMLYAMHDITRNCWLEEKQKKELFEAFKNDPDCNKVLTIRATSFKDFVSQFDFKHLAIGANLLPTLAALLLLWLQWKGIPIR